MKNNFEFCKKCKHLYEKEHGCWLCPELKADFMDFMGFPIEESEDEENEN